MIWFAYGVIVLMILSIIERVVSQVRARVSHPSGLTIDRLVRPEPIRLERPEPIPLDER